ncbi:unnamed protein product [Arctogadus glacialis]
MQRRPGTASMSPESEHNSGGNLSPSPPSPNVDDDGGEEGAVWSGRPQEPMEPIRLPLSGGILGNYASLFGPSAAMLRAIVEEVVYEERQERRSRRGR